MESQSVLALAIDGLIALPEVPLWVFEERNLLPHGIFGWRYHKGDAPGLQRVRWNHVLLYAAAPVCAAIPCIDESTVGDYGERPGRSAVVPPVVEEYIMGRSMAQVTVCWIEIVGSRLVEPAEG